jgi:hypothetical protein
LWSFLPKTARTVWRSPFAPGSAPNQYPLSNAGQSATIPRDRCAIGCETAICRPYAPDLCVSAQNRSSALMPGTPGYFDQHVNLCPLSASRSITPPLSALQSATGDSLAMCGLPHRLVSIGMALLRCLRLLLSGDVWCGIDRKTKRLRSGKQRSLWTRWRAFLNGSESETVPLRCPRGMGAKSSDRPSCEAG